MQGKCVPAGQKGQGQQLGRGMGDGPMGKPMTKAQEMFAADFPEFKKIEKTVDMLVDSAMTECGMSPGDSNNTQNTPSNDAEEELDRVHDDIAGYGDPDDEDREYSAGDSGYYKDEDEEEINLGSQLESVLQEEDYKTYFKSMMDKEGIDSIEDLSDEKKKSFFNKVDSMWKAKNESLQEQGEYHAFFKRMMDQEGISSIGQLSPEEKSSFFSKISAGWKKEKGKSVAESFKHLIK